ncbi:MAG: DUF882 domain-containing protein [Alphaproteobacteria bacterium]|nr:MAG: DUF882 domain-containing protein [Alphaproteobacteria bacterium]
MKRKNAARLGLALCLSFNLAAAAPGSAALPPAHVAAQQLSIPAQQLETPDIAAEDDAPSDPAYTLKFYNVHTGENLRITRRDGEALDQDEKWFMRDYRRGETIDMDPELFDLLADIQTQVKWKHPKISVQFQVVSSYRAPETNEGLRQAGGEQAKHSLHMRGKAMDIRISGVTTRELRDIVTCIGEGGVGYYAEDQFIHVDTGRVRYWPSRAYVSAVKCNTQKQPVVASAKQKSRRGG